MLKYGHEVTQLCKHVQYVMRVLATYVSVAHHITVSLAFGGAKNGNVNVVLATYTKSKLNRANAPRPKHPEAAIIRATRAIIDDM